MGVVAKRIYDPTSSKWMDDPGVKCKHNGAIFYPDRPSSDVAKAKAICNGALDGVICPRRTECAQYAITHHESHGVWGGMSERDRRKVQRARKLTQNRGIFTLEDVKFPGTQKIVPRRVKLRVVRNETDGQSSADPRTDVPGADKAHKPGRSTPFAQPRGRRPQV